MNARRSLWLLALAGLLLLAALPWLVERGTTTVTRPPSRLAVLNPALALHRLVEARGRPAETSFRLDPRPPRDRRVYVPEGTSERRAALWEGMLPWVAAGGTLVVGLPAGPEGAPWEDLTARFGVEVEELDDALRGTDSELLFGPAARPLLVRTGGGPRLGLLLSEGEEAFVNAAGQSRALRLPWGEGHVWLVADPAPLHNEAIAEGDHLLWAEALLALDGEGGLQVLLDPGQDRGLLTLAWTHARPLLLGLLLGLLLALMRANASLSPPRAVPSTDRRDLLEHMAAAGRFLWEQGRLDALLEACRRRAPEGSTPPPPGDEAALIRYVRAAQARWRSG